MRTYIIHVSTDVAREKHILEQIKDKGLAFEFVLEGDKSDITEEIKAKYFSGKMLGDAYAAGRSCTYKHLLTYRRLLQMPGKYFLVLEDDMIFYSQFTEKLNKILAEAERDNLSNCVISMEDSNLKYVKGSLRKKEKMIYPQKRGRMTGIYIIDREAAQNILAYVDKHKVTEVIDWMHNVCADAGAINIYWSQPALGVQGSLNGQMESLLASKPSNYFRIYSFKFQRAYKRFLYWLR